MAKNYITTVTIVVTIIIIISSISISIFFFLETLQRAKMRDEGQ